MPSRRLSLALAASLLLHALALIGGLPDKARRPPPMLQATLRMPSTPPVPVEPLLKNTLAPETATAPEPPPPPPPLPEPRAARAKPAAKPPPAAKRQVELAQRKLNEHIYYPPQAIEHGLEGEVRLLLILAADGRIEDVQLAASSGHALLDNAAIRAAFAMGSLPGLRSRELILPVIFRLQ